jgi:SAM-dependent methyltransferase
MSTKSIAEFEKHFWILADNIQHEKELSNVGYLNDYIRAYSSKGHLYDIYRDLNMVQDYLGEHGDILDFGCGMGFQSVFLSDMGYRVIGVETVSDKSIEGFFKGNTDTHEKKRINTLFKNWDLLKSKREHLDYELYDGRCLPYKNGAFDAILAYAVLEHIPKEEIPGILENLSRVLKPNGLLFIFQLPQKYSYTEYTARKMGWQSHPYLWSIQEITSLLSSQRFEVLYLKPSGMLFNQPYRLANRLFSFMKWFNKMFTVSPLSIVAHHINIIARHQDGR